MAESKELHLQNSTHTRLTHMQPLPMCIAPAITRPQGACQKGFGLLCRSLEAH